MSSTTFIGAAFDPAAFDSTTMTAVVIFLRLGVVKIEVKGIFSSTPGVSKIVERLKLCHVNSSVGTISILAEKVDSELVM